MNILFTGASSFTGYWFVRELTAAGHNVTSIFRRPAGEYTDVRKKRLDGLSGISRVIHGVSFGTPEFIELIKQGGFELLCHHAADVTNYKSADFNTTEALAANTRNIAAVCAAFAAAAGNSILLTGSVFENDEGAGSEGLPAFSPYGLSKALTAQMFRYYARAAGLPLGKFVIPNPFGPFEEPRFTAFLVKNWFAGKTPSVETPAYVRDNIHVSLLAQCYAKYAADLVARRGPARLNPSGYVESQGAFALRFAREMKSRLQLPCEVELKVQTQFAEPRIRINTDLPDAVGLGWNEAAAWDQVAEYYQQLYGHKA
jgi:nucleoside-diphosphate-sugar epimerase